MGGSDLLSHGELLLDPQQLVFGRHQVLLQVLLRGGVDAERVLVVLLQGGHRALQAAQVLLPRRPLVVGGGEGWLLLVIVMFHPEQSPGPYSASGRLVA